LSKLRLGDERIQAHTSRESFAQAFFFRDYYVYTMSESFGETVHKLKFPYAFWEDLVQEIYKVKREDKHGKIFDVFGVDKFEKHPSDHYHQRLNKTSDGATVIEDKKG
jgi:hypothetical protein